MGQKKKSKQQQQQQQTQTQQTQRKAVSTAVSHFKEVQTTHFLHLPPVFIGNTMAGVEENLNRLLTRYNDHVEGVVLSYWDIQALSTTGAILYDSPFFHFNVSCKMLVFSPCIGARITGVVNKQSSGHIGLLLYNLFNASIPLSEIPQHQFEFQLSGDAPAHSTADSHLEKQGSKRKGEHMLAGSWLHKPTGQEIEIGSEIDFTVLELVRANDMLSIRGSLVNVDFSKRKPAYQPRTARYTATTGTKTRFDVDEQVEEEENNTGAAEAAATAAADAELAEDDNDMVTDADVDAGEVDQAEQELVNEAKSASAAVSVAEVDVDVAAVAKEEHARQRAGKKSKTRGDTPAEEKASDKKRKFKDAALATTPAEEERKRKRTGSGADAKSQQPLKKTDAATATATAATAPAAAAESKKATKKSRK
ncbi:hypothetical protein RI367_007354 [Sorochytrium milnesiophthora]